MAFNYDKLLADLEEELKNPVYRSTATPSVIPAVNVEEEEEEIEETPEEKYRKWLHWNVNQRQGDELEKAIQRAEKFEQLAESQREEQLERWEEIITQPWKLEKESHFTVNEAHYIEGYIFTGEHEEYDLFFKALVAKDFEEIIIIENDFEDLLWRVSGEEFVKQKKNADKLLMDTIKKNRVRIITGVK